VIAVALVVLLGASGSLMIPALQTRLIDVAPEGPSLAATMNHSALNLANAIGAFLGGLVIAAGYGYTAPALVGAGLAIAGLGVLGAAVVVGRRQQAHAR
jgi:DHA1 family inner membrane transport protein